MLVSQSTYTLKIEKRVTKIGYRVRVIWSLRRFDGSGDPRESIEHKTAKLSRIIIAP
jgi:hypothetical protein